MDRYKLDIGNAPGEWVCTDLKHKIVCVFKDGAYNQTQKFTELDNETVDLGVDKLATIVREMSDWLLDHHRDLLIINYRSYIGQRVKELRLAAGLTQEELATRAGLLRSNLNRIENSKYNVTAETLGAIAEALDKKIDLIDK